MCLLTILTSAEGSGIVQLRYQKPAMPKISINIFDVSKGGVGRGSQKKHTIDVSCGQNRDVGLPEV